MSIIDALKSMQTQYGFPGATFACVLSNGSTQNLAIGYADVERKTLMTPQTKMLAASIGKSFVAAMVLQLDREGRLNLDDPLSKWLGNRTWFSHLPNHATITLRHLLTHTSGLPDHVRSPAFLRAYSENREILEPEKLVAFILDQPPLFEPGKSWMYTDTGYILLGLVIETVTENTYYHELKKRFLLPLQLRETIPSDQSDLPHLAAGYTKPDNPFGLPVKSLLDNGTMAWNPIMEWTGGGIASTPSDLAKWAKLLFEGHAMKEEYLSDLLKKVPVSKDRAYGMGVVITDEFYGHQGVIPGYTSSMRYYPKYKSAFAFQINTDIGVFDHTSNLLNDMEERLGGLIISSY